MSHRTLNEKLALKILANEGIEAIWRLHIAAADAYRIGRERRFGVPLPSVPKRRRVWRLSGDLGAGRCSGS